MQSLILWNEDELEFEPQEVERVFRTQVGFDQIQFNEPRGALIEAQYSSELDDDHVLVRLAGDRRMISITSVSDASLRAALTLQRNIRMPLRMMDDDYTFDLKLSGYTTVDELNAAIEKAQQET